MGAAVIGLLSALVGFIVGAGFAFWSTRRSELAAAVVACSILAEEMRATFGSDAPASDAGARLQKAWEDHRDALVCEMRPEDFARVAHAMHAVTTTGAAHSRDLASTMSALAELFWKEHQAFILVPLANYVRGTTLSKKAHSAIEHGMHDSPIPSPAADRPGASRSTPA